MMSPSVIKAVKQAGLEDDRPAWDIMEEAAKQWLERRKGKRNEQTCPERLKTGTLLRGKR